MIISTRSKQLRFIDFFAGIGGFRLGMEKAGHTCVGHCEIDKFAQKSYEIMHNVKKGEWFADDITTVKPSDLPEAEVYCFGFPCQSFSIAGKRQGFDDIRGTMFFEVMRLAKERQPDLLFAENVKGLLNHNKGETFRIILETLDEVGYDAEWQVLNSKHFGVPHNRERVFILGHKRTGECRQPIFPLTDDGSEIVGDTSQKGNTHINTITARYANEGTGSYVSQRESTCSKSTNEID